MIDTSFTFGSLTSNSSRINKVSNPISNFTPNFSNYTNNSSIFSSQTEDKKEYKMEESQVAYANPFAFLNNSSDNSEVSAFAA